MRVSTNYIFENSRRIMQKGISNLLLVQEQMATQRKVNHLSDDPVAVGKILNVNAMIGQHEQFVVNLDTGNTFAKLYDSSMDSVNSVLVRAKELLIGQANSAAATDQTREAARIELVSLAGQLVAIGNLQYSDRFLYAGYSDGSAPFRDMFPTVTPGPGNTGDAAATYQTVADPAHVTGDAYEIRFTSATQFDIVDTTTTTPVSQGNSYASGALIQFDGISLRLTDGAGGGPAAGDVFAVATTPAGEYAGDSGVVNLEIEQDVFQQVNFTGDTVFQGVGLPGGVNLFDLFQRANAALRSNDQTEINALLEDFDQGARQVSAQQSLAGSRQKLFDNTSSRLLDVKLNMEVLRSDLRDIDITDAVTELSRQDSAYQAVLSATGKILQPSLLDYIG